MWPLACTCADFSFLLNRAFFATTLCMCSQVGSTPTDDEIAEMIAMADADGSGSIDFAEFVTLMAHNMTAEKTRDDLKMAFNIFDRSGDGNISPEELQRIMINVGEPVTLEDVNSVIGAADEDGDGEINFDEFVNVVILGGRGSKDKKRSERESEPGDDGGAPASAKKAAAGGAIRTVEVS